MNHTRLKASTKFIGPELKTSHTTVDTTERSGKFCHNTAIKYSHKGQIQFPKTDDEIDQWSRKYHDVALIVDTIACKRANEAMEEGDKRLARLKQLETKLTRKNTKQQLVQVHPDFHDIRQDRHSMTG